MGSIAPKSNALKQALACKKKEVGKPVLLTIAETCDCLRISRTSMYRLINERKLASVSILKRRLIPLDAVETFIAQGTEGAV
jgi:excisionase family DNA binding protein